VNALIDALGLRTLGFILLGIAAILLLVAVLIIMGAVTRWQAIASLDDYRLKALAGNGKEGQALAKEAATLLGSEATTALAAIDLGDPAAGAALQNIISRVPPAQRPAVETALALHQALNGQAVSSMPEGGNGAAIRHIVELAKGGKPATLELPKDSPAYATVLVMLAHRRFQAAWTSGDAQAIRQTAGELALAAPLSPHAKPLLALTRVLEPDVDTNQIRPALDLIRDADTKLMITRALALLVPRHAVLLVQTIPADKRTPDERALLQPQSTPTPSPGSTPSAAQAQAGAANRNPDLELVVRAAMASPTEVTLETLIARSINEGRTDLARKMLELVRVERKPQWQFLIAEAEGDLATILRLAPNKPEYQPRTSKPVFTSGAVSFHLSTSNGFVPRNVLGVTLAGKPIPRAQVQRVGSLVTIDVGTGRGALEVKLADRTVLSTKVSP
jgi:hypothetical protein